MQHITLDAAFRALAPAAPVHHHAQSLAHAGAVMFQGDNMGQVAFTVALIVAIFVLIPMWLFGSKS